VLWGKKRKVDRNELIAAADRARARGRTKKAIAGYRRVLEVAPGDPAVHAKLAPLLARTGRKDEALASFRSAAAAQIKAGFTDRGVSLLVQAADAFPEEYALWEEITRLHLQRGRRADALAALLGGGKRLLHSRQLTAGGQVLRRALEIEPWHPQATTLLARVLARSGRKGEALELVDGLDARTRGAHRRRLRWLAFRISPSPRRLWRALLATLAGR
jgi:tetratricopeptide (TPR) repeat protein